MLGYPGKYFRVLVESLVKVIRVPSGGSPEMETAPFLQTSLFSVIKVTPLSSYATQMFSQQLDNHVKTAPLPTAVPVSLSTPGSACAGGEVRAVTFN